MDVQFSGTELDNDQKDIVNKYADKFSKACEAESLHINLKAHTKAGGRVSYTTQLRAETGRKGRKTAEKTAEDIDWDFHMSVKTAFAKLHKEFKGERKSLLRRILRRDKIR